ncbi:MAG TPA: sigma-70 family RNA polymerase sigma factor [Planctomycetota bacterium]|nr:sigma-70 family RNA polymerase sigma factor [Planctomycetota bacterium]
MKSATDPAATDAWQRISNELRAFVRRRVRDEHAAEDLVQEVFARLAQEVAKRGQPPQLAPWLFRTARNAVVDHHRAHRPAAGLPEGLSDPAVVDPAEAEIERLLGSCRSFVHGLPPKYREAVLLTEYEGLSQVQLAERLGIPVSTAKSRVQRGRAQLQKALTECCTFDLDRRGGVVDWRRRARGDGPPCC